MGLIRQIPGISHLPIIDVVQQRFEYEQDDEHKRKELIQLEVIHRVKGTEWIPLIYQSMIQKVVLQIVYQPFSDDEMSFYLHPYLLKEWRNRWYVFGREGREGREKNEKTSGNTARQWLIERMGFIPRSDHIWNVPLDRIISIHNCPDIPFLENDLFDPDTWFDEIAGVTKPENTAPIQIEMEADTIAYYYIESKPFHASQSLLFRDEEKAVFSLKLIPNYEIITDILAYGKYVRVRSPESFKKMLSDIKS